MKRISILIFLISNYVCGQGNIIFPNDFVETDYRILKDRSWNVSKKGGLLSVDNCNNTIVIKQNSLREYARLTYLLTDFGLLLGFNEGEWPGGLYDKSKANPPRLIKEGNVTLLHRNPEKEAVYFISKGALYGSSFERIYKDTVELNLKTEIISTVPDVITTYTYISNKLFVAGVKNLYFLEDKNFVPIFNDNVWQNIYCHSMISEGDNTLLIGLDRGVLKVDLTTKTMKLFIIK